MVAPGGLRDRAAGLRGRATARPRSRRRARGQLQLAHAHERDEALEKDDRAEHDRSPGDHVGPAAAGGVRVSRGGNGDPDDYIFGGVLTKEIWRLSLGLGYRWNANLLTKAEYSFERGKEIGGARRAHEDLFAVEAAFKF